VRRVGRGSALYVGDDATDEDAFRSDAVRVSVRVGPAHASAARYFLRSQADIDDLLRALVRSRRRLDGADDRIEALERMVGS
jgi:trehalose 6-phosphate phosphatase